MLIKQIGYDIPKTADILIKGKIMKRVTDFLKKELMLTAAVAAAAVSLFISPPNADLLKSIDWRTLVTLFMMLTVLEGFKKENIFRPILKFAEKIGGILGLSFFLIFGVFFSSMFVTNDVSLIIFVPLTVILFRSGGKEKYILPVISMENIAAIRGSLLLPFGSPQNLFLYGKSGVSAGSFILHMSPLWVSSAVLLSIFIIVLYRKDLKEKIEWQGNITEEWNPKRKRQRLIYLCLFVMIIFTVLTRTPYYLGVAAIVLCAVLVFDREILIKTDYVLILTFFCFFVFSSSIAANSRISGFLTSSVGGHEYVWGILLSQIISNVPASIVLYPFTKNLAALLYGVDTAGLCSLIGSLASVINYRIYVREYPENGRKFIKTFTLISLAFFAVVAVPGFLISKYWTF